MKNYLVVFAVSSALVAGAVDFPEENAAATVSEAGTYTAAKDMTWTSLNFNTAGAYLWDLTGYTATLTGTGGNILTLSVKDTDVTFKGGALAFTGAAPSVNTTGGTRGANRSLTFDGTAVTGSGLTFIGAYGSDPDSSVILTNAASVSLKQFTLTSNSPNAKRCSLIVTGGSTLSTTDTFATDGGNSYQDINARVLVDGEGSKITVGNNKTMTLGNGQRKIFFDVLNGGAYTGGGTVNMASGRCASDVHVCVSNQASFAAGNVYLGSFAGSTASSVWYDATHDNSFEVLDNSTATISGNLYIGSGYNSKGSSNNLVRVVNSTLTGSSIYPQFSGVQCSANRCLVTGNTARLETSSSMKALFFNGAHDNLFEIADRATWTALANFRTGDSASNNVIRISGGATATFTGYSFGHYANDSTKAYHGDRLEVLDGATLTANVFRMGSDSNSLVVSNGTITATNTGTAGGDDVFDIGHSNYYGTNNVVTLEGNCPLLESKGCFYICGTTDINFKIPAGGYAENHVPIKGVKIEFKVGSVLKVDVSEFRPTLTRKTEVTLVQATTGFTLNQIIAASNASAPEGCEFAFDSDKKSIVLKVKPPKRGFVILFE